MKGEFELIDHIRGHFKEVPQGVVGIGDDCSIIEGEGEEWLFSTDLVVEGVHFLRTKSSPEDVGWKSAAVNLSDIAAMGGEPAATFLSIALPKDARGEWAERFVEGYAAISHHYGVPLLGGDTTSSLRDVAVNVGVLGKAPKGTSLLRSGARVGDTIFVTGPLGDSGAGLKVLLGDIPTDDTTAYLTTKHNRPTPRIAEGIALRKTGKVGAMMDISDGIASDINHIMKLSQVGARIELNNIPTDYDIRYATTGGEDYELLLTVDKRKADELAQRFEEKFGKPLYNIGRVVRPNYDCYYIGIEREDGEILHSTAGWGGYHHF